MTVSGNHSVGIKAPHRKADPRDITFTMPLTASLLSINVDKRRAKVREVKIKISRFIAYTSPLKERMVLLKRIVPSNINKSHTIIE